MRAERSLIVALEGRSSVIGCPWYWSVMLMLAVGVASTSCGSGVGVPEDGVGGESSCAIVAMVGGAM